MAIKIRVCEECGREFEVKPGRSGHPRFCYGDHYRNCAICGKEFLVPRDKLGNKAAPLCSPECVRKAKGVLAVKSAKMHPKYHKICEFCGEYFDCINPNQRICSNDHYLTCVVCGKVYLAKDYQLTGNHKTCSDKCRYILSQKTYQDHYSIEANPEAHAAMIAKTRQTTFSRHGYYNALSPEGRELSGAAQAFRDKFGADYPGHVKSIMDKRAKTTLERYGSTCSLVNPEVAKKSRNTLLSKYGVDNYAKSREFLKQVITDPEKASACKEFRDDPEAFIQSHFPDHAPTLAELSDACGIIDSSVGYILDQAGHPDIVSYTYSRMEDELFEFLSSELGPNKSINRNTFKIITPYELDLYIPDLKLGVECNPTVTHNSTIPAWSKADDPKPSNYHKMKTDMCDQQDIFLFHIFGYEWSHKKEIIKSMLRNIINSTPTKLYARKTDIKKVSDHDAFKFLEDNHRQGGTHSKIRLGLYHEDELVSLMTFSNMRPTIGKTADSNSDCYELVRFCNKLNTSVVGGASKLFAHFIRKYNPTEIRSFSDRAHTRGLLYEQLGFKYDHTTDPGYVWVNLKTDRGYSRNNAQKCNIKKFLNDYEIDLNKTETQIMKEHGFVQVFDSGVKLWIWKNTTSL